VIIVMATNSLLKPINLLRGWPAPSLLPATALSRASATVLAYPAVYVPALQYGPDPGYQPLREALASWLGAFYKHHSKTPFGPDRIAITGGGSQSIACLLQSYTDPSYTRAVWMVAPCYFLACPIFADSGFAGRMRAVPEDEQGIDLGFLEREIAKAEEAEKDANSGADSDKPRYKDPQPYRKIYRHVIYCVPSFANPSGKTMSLARREALVQLARKWDALVICDDIYDMLQWQIVSNASSSSSSPNVSSSNLETALLPRLLDLDLPLGPSKHDPPGRHFGHVVSNGSFSKLVGPGLRTGWVDGTPDMALGVSQTGSTRSGGAPSQFSAATVNELLRSGHIDTHLREQLRPAYQRRHARMLETVQRVIVPLGAQVRVRSLVGDEQEQEKDVDVFGGYFIWLKFPDGPSVQAIADRCRDEENLIIGQGKLFEVLGDEAAVSLDREMRLCFSWEDEESLVEGVERLGRVIERVKKDGAAGVVYKSRDAGGAGEFK
jgi:DNA-binding transcriptional MocR family regulator